MEDSGRAQGFLEKLSVCQKMRACDRRHGRFIAPARIHKKVT